MEQNQIPALPEYVCHKRVQAARILSIHSPSEDGSRLYALKLDLPGIEFQLVPVEYIQKHKPEVGGYFVRYADGYSSYSPAKAFEEGYSRTSNKEPITLEQLRHNEQVAAEWRAAETPMFSEKELAALKAYDGPPLRFNQIHTLKGMGDGPDGIIGSEPDHG